MNGWAVAGLIVGGSVIITALMLLMIYLLVGALGVWGGVISIAVVVITVFVTLGWVFTR